MSSRLAFDDLELDDDTREVSRGGRHIELTDTEYRLLRYLMSNPRRVLTRAQLLDHVWSYDFGGDARVLETYISYLRKKVDAEGAAADPHRARRRLLAAAAEVLAMSLRARLMVGLLVLAAAGLITLAAVTYAEQRSFLYDRADQQLKAASDQVSHELADQNGGGPAGGGFGALGAGGGRRRPAATAAGPPAAGAAAARHLRPAPRRERQAGRRAGHVRPTTVERRCPRPELPANMPRRQARSRSAP